ncbi:hypothetical protein [Arthrobacter sp. GMC3]|uniref:hypothetical protein n=1 Tax=Arthrobacter sp. GMC3 TaxID=2058894 RepID=UPI000CE2CB54|nr:hypothetical protein [Arthrobacter sp. GMC3]
MYYGVFQWAFMALAFIFGISALVRIEAFSTHSTQRTKHHPGQQVVLWLGAAIFALAAFVVAVMALRAGMR